MSRHPYTHDADFIRSLGPFGESGVVLSRSDASQIRQGIAKAIGMENEALVLACSASESLIANTSSGPTPEDFKPNYKSSCMNCGQKPTVDVFVEGNMVRATKLCGPCNFGDTSTIDPENW